MTISNMDTAVPSLSRSAVRVKLGTRFYLLFAVFVFVQFPIHELGHLLAFEIAGIPAEMSLNRTSPLDPAMNHAGAVLAGPLLTLGIAAFAAWGFWRFRRFRLAWAAVAFSAASFRLLLYVVLTVAALSGSEFGSNDEPIAADLLGLPDLTFVALLGIPFVIVVAAVMVGVEGSRLKKLGHIVLMLIITFGIATVVEQGLQPLVFPS